MSNSTTSCPVCGSAQTGFFAQKAEYSFSKCAACAFVFIDPAPSSDFLATLYTGDDRGISEDHYPKAKLRLRRAMLKAARLSPYVWGKDVIDIGCGGGFNVEAMRRFRARAVGLDINSHAIAYAVRHFPKNRFFCEHFNELRRRDTRFDFVYSSQVLEHVPDVNDFVKVLSHITHPGGFVYVKTPDRDHWRVPQNVASPDVPDPPKYLQFFNKTNIRIFFERHGFEVRKIFFKIKPSLQLLAQRT